MDLDKVIEAKTLALKLISQYLRTESEIRNKLIKKGYREEVIDQAIKELIEGGFIDDQQYTSEWLRIRLAVKPCGRMLCFKKLRERGVDEEIAREILDNTYSHEDELIFATKLAQHKYNDLKISGKKNIKEKTAFYLKNKGFGTDIIYNILDKL